MFLSIVVELMKLVVEMLNTVITTKVNSALRSKLFTLGSWTKAYIG